MKTIIVTLFVCIPFLLSSQNELPSGQIEVIKDFEVRLAEAGKIRIIPAPITIDTSTRHYEYHLNAPSPAIEYETPEFKPLTLAQESKPAYYPFFVKAGYGNPNSFLGQLSYDHQQGDHLDWSVDINHLSANSKKIPLQKFSQTGGTVDGSYLLNENVQASGRIKGDFETVFFYGADEIPGNPDALRRRYNRYDAAFSISNSAEINPSMTYSAQLQYLFDKDDFGSKERTLRIGGEGALLIGSGEHPVGLRVLADLTKFQHVDEFAINNLHLSPYFEVQSGQLKLHLGAGSVLSKTENEILPDIEISYHLPGPLLSLYAGWKGEVIKNNYHFLSTYNPFIIERLDSINNFVSRSILGGVRGVTGVFHYEVEANYSTFERMVFFLQDSEDPEQFIPLFDGGSYVEIKGSLQCVLLKNIRLSGNSFGRFYSLNEETKPWHRPSFGVSASAMYGGFEERYHLGLTFHGEGGLPYRTVGGTVATHKALVDLNLLADYFITEHIGAFAEVNNILGNKRERWTGYPSYGFNAKVGIMLRLDAL